MSIAPGPPHGDVRGRDESCEWVLSPQLWNSVREAAAEQRASESQLLLAALAALAYGKTGSRRVALTTPPSPQRAPRFPMAGGSFYGEVEVRPALPFDALVRSVRRLVLDWVSSPGAAPPTRSSRWPESHPAIPCVRLSWTAGHPGEVRGPLTEAPAHLGLAVQPRCQAIGGVVSAHCTGPFGDAATAALLLRQTLQTVIAHPQVTLEELCREEPPSVAPQDEHERELARIWQSVLGIEPIGRRESFFDLGGDSLVGVRLLSRIGEELGARLPMAALFEASTIELLARRIEAALGSVPSGRSPGPAPVNDPTGDVGTQDRTRQVPLSFGQQRLWFLEQLAPGSSAYHTGSIFRLRGALELERLQLGVAALVERHETLRARMPVAGDEAMQVFDVAAPLVAVIDLQSHPAGDRDREAQRIAEDELAKPYDLTHGPLFRLAVIRTGPRDQWLVIGLHHLISDGWSHGVFLRELSQLYSSGGSRLLPGLSRLPVSFGEYVRRQRESLASGMQRHELEFWKEQLGGAETHLELPADRPRPALSTHQGARITLELPADQSRRLREVAREHDATLFMLLFSAYAVLLSRHSGQCDFLIGTPVAGRTQRDTEGLIGLFLNTLAIRADLRGAPTFAELVARIRQRTLAAFAHQELPFEKLVEELHPNRGQSGSPLFQVMFILQNTPEEALELPGLAVERMVTGGTTAKFDLTLSISNTGAGLRATAEYSTELFDAARIGRMLGHFETLLRGIARSPALPVSRLPILTGVELDDLLASRASQPHSCGDPGSLPAQVLRLAHRHPEKCAVQSGGGSLTYAELAERVTAVAVRVRGAGVAPGSVVAVCVDRSEQLPALLLGVLLSGCAYLPLDPHLPKERLLWMLEDAGAALVLADRVGASRLDGRAVPVMDAAHVPVAEASLPEFAPPHQDDLAYVIYTSGSTGRPKGVEIRHRALLNLLTSMQREPGFSAEDVLLAVTTYSFDIAALELFLPLLTGGQLVIVSRETAADGEALQEQLRRSRATVLQATPATWRLLLEAGWDGSPSLRAWCGGETFPPDLAVQLRARCGEVWNLYGPTETTIWSAVYPVDDETPVPIGGPIADTELHVLDAAGELAPVGVVGELVIGGGGLARGYRNRPDLTAERFVPHPFSREPGARLYRTGDRAWRRADGSMEVLGRVDHQIKLRGFRIEPAEIEATLGEHPSVRGAVVIRHEGESGEGSLVGYIASDVACEAEVLSHARRRLPEHMLPRVLVRMNALPLTPNGKINRKALPAPGAMPAVARDRTPPSTPLEQTLAGLFQEVLGVEAGLHDSFFELGGHSLLAVRLASAIRRRLGRPFPLATLFQASTVSALAATLGNDGWEPSWSPLVGIQPKGCRPPVFFVHGMGGNVLCFRDLARRLGEEQPFYGLQAPGLDGAPPDYWSIEELATRYVDAVRSVQPEGPYRIGGFSIGGHIAFEMAHQLLASGAEVRLLALLDTPGPGYPRYYSPLPRALSHIRYLATQKPQEWRAYISHRVASRINYWKWRLWYRRFQEKVDHGETLPGYLQDVGLGLRRAYARYQHRPYPGRITLFRAEIQPIGCFEDLQNGWGLLAGEGVEVRHVPGEHAAIAEEPHVEKLAQELSDALRQS